MGLDFDPWFAAEAAGVRVGERRMRPGRRGEYDHAKRLIWLAPGLPYRVARATLTHELMHAHAGDVPSPFGLIVERQERLARRRTASLLIDAAEYAEAEALREGWVAGIAIDLDVTSRVVLDWQAMLEAQRDRAA
jgi:hypothetical protein